MRGHPKAGAASFDVGTDDPNFSIIGASRTLVGTRLLALLILPTYV